MSKASPGSKDERAVTDDRRHPERYRIGRGEQGVLTVEPYKSEILPHWRFRTPAEARKSAARIFAMFRAYGRAGDFAGMDMARKFLQMGYTRARRYANRRSGRKYAKGTRKLLPRQPDALKAASAAVFYKRWRAAVRDKTYQTLLREHRLRNRTIPHSSGRSPPLDSRPLLQSPKPRKKGKRN